MVCLEFVKDNQTAVATHRFPCVSSVAQTQCVFNPLMDKWNFIIFGPGETTPNCAKKSPLCGLMIGGLRGVQFSEGQRADFFAGAEVAREMLRVVEAE